MVGLECDDDNCDWIKGKSNRRRSGVQTEIGDNFSLRFFGLVSRRRGWIVWLRMYHVELQRFKILGQVRMHMFGKSRPPGCKSLNHVAKTGQPVTCGI